MPTLRSAKERLNDLLMTPFAHNSPVINPDWVLSASELRDVKIRWPRVYQWPESAIWMEPFVDGFPKHVAFEIVDDIPQPYKGTVNLQIAISGKRHEVAIGYSDYMPIDSDCANQVALYFKMQYQREGYGLAHVVPGGYVAGSKRLYLYLNKMRRLRDAQQFRYEVYGRFGAQFGTEIRKRATTILREQNSFPFEGGLKIVGFREFLEETALSRVCIDLPGTGDFCFRLVSYLAIGSCVVGFPHRTALHVPLIPGEHIAYARPDFSDLTALCEHYLADEREREALAHNARQYFELNLHPENLVRYYLRTCLDRLR